VRGLAAGAEEDEREGGGPGESEGERGEEGDGHGEGERAEEGSGDAGDRDERQEDNDGVMVDPMRGRVISARALRTASIPMFTGLTMQSDIFDDDDGVIDNEADGGSESAEGHEVEALADGPEHE